MFNDIPKYGKILCIVSAVVFTISCAYLIKQNAKLRREGDESKRRLAEIIAASVLTGLSTAVTGILLWEFV